MDISSLLNASPAPNSQSGKLPSGLDQLLQSSGIDARVVKIDKSGALLATRLGEILGKNVLDLKVGDLIRIRLDTSVKTPVLKVIKTSAEPMLLDSVKNRPLYQALNKNQSYTALVTRHQPGNSRIQIGSAQYSIAHQTSFKTGQLLALKAQSKINAIEVKPINTEQVLKSALTKLLPQLSNPETRNALSQLVRILRTGAAPPNNSGLNLKQAPGAVNKAGESTGTKIEAATLIGRNQTTASNSGAIDRALYPLAARLGNLLDSIPSISAINSRVIQQWIAYAGLIKLDAGLIKPDAGQQATPQNPLAILQLLPDTESTLKQLIQLLFRSRPESSAGPDKSSMNPEVARNEPATSLVSEIMKLIDQSLNQQLFQKVNARHQQELQQPLALNLSIPFTDRESVNDLQLKIRQRERDASSEKQCWDIHLSFEFGDLGLITSHINLDGNLLSTSFWSVLAETKQKIDQAIPEFEQLLVNSGFITGQFRSFAGLPPKDTSLDLAIDSEALLDIKV